MFRSKKIEGKCKGKKWKEKVNKEKNEEKKNFKLINYIYMFLKTHIT